MNSILIADDHVMFRQGLRLLLKADTRFRVVGEVEDGEQALAFIERERPSIAILDVAMPKLSGIEVVRRVAAQNIDTKCIMLTMHEEPEVVLSAMEAGAMGYILKGHTFDDLKAALQAVRDRHDRATDDGRLVLARGHRGRAVAQADQQVVQHLGRLWVKARIGLVEQQHRRVVQQGPCDGQALHHAA